MESKVRIGVRGASGLLGSRLVAVVDQTSDMEVSLGIFKNDATLKRMISRSSFGGPHAKKLPKKMFLDESDDIIESLNSSSLGFYKKFFPISEINFNEDCDVIVDATAGQVKGVLQKKYQSFQGPILLQDGSYPVGRLIAPPLMALPQGGNKYRQGGCFLSGVVPVLQAFGNNMKSVRLHLVMQYDGRENDFTITERLNSFLIADNYIPRMEVELSQLFPEVQTKVESVVQIPGMLHYAVSVELETKTSLEVHEITSLLEKMPRICVLPESVMSTYELNMARAIDDRIPPIHVFSGSIFSSNNVVKLKLALYYRTLAVLPNLDTIRVLVQKMDPISAMKKTDEDMGF